MTPREKTIVRSVIKALRRGDDEDMRAFSLSIARPIVAGEISIADAMKRSLSPRPKTHVELAADVLEGLVEGGVD